MEKRSRNTLIIITIMYDTYTRILSKSFREMFNVKVFATPSQLAAWLNTTSYTHLYPTHTGKKGLTELKVFLPFNAVVSLKKFLYKQCSF